MFLVTSHEMKQMDQLSIDFFGIPERVLMENAGKAASDFFLELFQGKIYGSVGILAGRGNNGGDAFVVARYLSQRNIPVTVFLLSEKDGVKSIAAAANLDLLISLGVSFVSVPDLDAFNRIKFKFKGYSLWIDAIFGTGLRSGIEGFFSEIINFVNSLKRPIFAIDIPSGLNSDTGQVCGTCIHAFATVTFAFAKIGHFLHPAPKYVGELKVVDIGIPNIVIERVGCVQQLVNYDYIRESFSLREDDAHKGGSGHLIAIAGSPGKTGAAVMTSLGAMRSGAGLVTLCVPERLNVIVESMLVEAMTVGLPETSLGELDASAFQIIADLIKGKKCVVFGPGIGDGFGASSVLKQLIRNCYVPIVIDADGLNIIANCINILNDKKAQIVLTPHPGEMARLTGKSIIEVQSDRVVIARDFAEKFGVHVILKGAGTVIAHPNGEVFINSTGNSGMASGGMGDVLTGIVAAFITQGYFVDFAARLAVYIHGLSGDSMAFLKGPYGYLATDVINCIPEQIALLSS